MTLTLWRGEELLGELRLRAPSPSECPHASGKPPSVSAFLIPAANRADLEGVWQIHFPIPGLGVQQYPVEPDIVADRHRRASTRKTNPGPEALTPMSPEEVKGVPRERQLTVRDAAGQSFLPLQVHLEEVRYEPEYYEVVLRDAPAEVLVDGSVWWVLVVFTSELEAPAIYDR